MMLIEFIQKRIKEKMSEQRLTMRSLALNAGLKEDAVKIIFSGKSLKPSIETIYKIAQTLNCSMDELCGMQSIESSNPLRNKDIWIGIIERVDSVMGNLDSKTKANLYLACYELSLHGIEIVTASQIKALAKLTKQS